MKFKKHKSEAVNHFRREWLDALRDGEYGQTRCELRSGDNDFCCLGVACHLYDPQQWDGEGYPIKRGSSELEFQDLPLRVRSRLGMSKDEMHLAMTMNDDGGMTFEQIALVFERLWGLR